jgi:galactosylceramidase
MINNTQRKMPFMNKRTMIAAAVLASLLAAGQQGRAAEVDKPLTPSTAVHRKDTSLQGDKNPQSIEINLDSSGRTFEGLGALSAGASSRLLFDYPEPQRSEILDFLFKPNYGASLQHLKGEIGGDVNSTDGTEPSIARTREEFDHPKPEYFNRGYEWWLMKEAKKRNPAIILDVLQWGAPGWVGGGKFYSQDNADFIVAFIKGAKQYHDLDINYCGIWNEKAYDVPWIKLLRATLDRAGLDKVQIVAADEVNNWSIANKMATDPELCKAVQVIGMHYCSSAPSATTLNLGKRIWASEDCSVDGSWNAKAPPGAGWARPIAQSYNRNYIVGKMTATVIWSPIAAYYDVLVYGIPGCGLMRAVEPWSGYYDVQPAIWKTAHTTQFIQPGWKYLDSACLVLPGTGSCVAAVAPDRKAFSMVLETLDANKPQKMAFRLAGGLSCNRLHVWRSTAKEQFIQQADLEVTGNAFEFAADAGAIYSLTTTEGQKKGVTTIPSATPMPLPYREDFSSYPVGRTPRWISDFSGVFETAISSDGRACLQQTVPIRGIEWCGDPHPLTVVGDRSWKDYEAACEVRIDFKKYAEIYGRVGRVHSRNETYGYVLRLSADGGWELSKGENIKTKDPKGKEKSAYGLNRLAEGRIAIKPGGWCRMGLRFEGNRIDVLLDKQAVGAVTDSTYSQGYVALGCDYEMVQFTDLSVTPRKAP